MTSVWFGVSKVEYGVVKQKQKKVAHKLRAVNASRASVKREEI